ncbi:kinase-like protein [Westerdykella ornata]|uniref:non-specific serine/threonine protein kinase n=1 Tax=Westerdykella ornata TaxID=318751 RepID=A0A6A6JWW9_WESOR|nr:kinase-like protein [Westerdykella ornata]KAF2280735.1 kinase-like protein [Westerdykella ornata]
MEHIGKGSFAEVYRGIHIEKRQAVAIKSVNMSKLNKKLKDNLMVEISILRSLHHPHIVSLINYYDSPPTARMHIVMEFCELGDLSAFIKKRDSLAKHPSTQRMMEKYPNPPAGGLNEVVVRHFTKQMASALEFLRSKDYIHRDLKPQNLLLTPSSMYYSQSGTLERMPLVADGSSLIPASGIASLPMLKIADFGFARLLPQTSLAETLCGSPLYMAPEILRYEKYDAKADLWSVGTVMYEMVTGKAPFRASNHVELLRKIEEQRDRIRFNEGNVISRPMKDLIRALLRRTPLERMSFDKFFNDPVVVGEIPGLVDEDLPHQVEDSLVKPRQSQKLPVGVERRAQESPYSQSPREKSSFGATPPSRPTSSRNTSGQQYGSTPPRPSSGRRMSNTPMPTIEQVTPQRERRPTLPTATTAPVRPATMSDRERALTFATSGRRYSRGEASGPATDSKAEPGNDRVPKRSETGAMRERAERVGQDSAIDDGFVFVEKRRVEIDALADEIAASPHAARDRISLRDAGMKRRATTQGSPTSTTGATVPSKAIQIQQKPFHQRGSSGRQYRPSFESATSALSKAMNMVTIRGLGLSPPMLKGVSPPQGYAAFPAYPAAQSSLVVVGEPGKTVAKDEDTAMIDKVEELAHLSHIVYGFAEVKYTQLVPNPPSETGAGNGARRNIDDDDDDDEDLTLDAIIQLCEEALVLYCKALGLLNKAMHVTGTYWNRRHRRSSSPTAGSRTVAPPDRLNHIVSFVRDRFNECCVKSEIVARKLKQAQKQVSPDHPAHPSNLSVQSGSANTIGSADNIPLSTGVTAEKLMYERALEMSRSAAVNELVGKDLDGSERNYFTAIRMLEAILEEEEESPADRNENEDINGLESEDRQSILNLLDSMKSRHRALERKIKAAAEAAKTTKRNSITGAPGSYPPSRSPRG